ncbi:MAG: DHH family phosphoesterase [Clostridia bacterium]|nr:DHH family phosphoesterase [Clostridia bacterium]
MKKINIRLILSVAVAVIYMCVYAVLCVSGLNPVIWCGVMCGCYLATVLLLMGVYSLIVSGTAALSVDDEIALSAHTGDLLTRLSQPVAICDDLGRIIYHNRAFSDVIDGGMHNSESFSELCGSDFKVIINNEGPEGVRCATEGHSFSVRAYPVNINDKHHYIMILDDCTALDAALARINEEEVQIAYIVIDNLAEILQFVREKSRSASAEIEAPLSGWADSVGGVLKEYERDKFFFMFHKCHLREFIEDKFEIVNKIRDIRVGEGNLPITVSIGVSGIDGTRAEKEAAAHAALDMALQRGGDQAAVKNSGEMIFFGGKTKTVQKRTKVRARVFASELIHHISLSSRVLIMGHARADMDSLGACVGIAKLVKFCGVQPFIVADSTDPNTAGFFDKLSTMKGYEDIIIDRAQALELNASDALLVIVDVNNASFFEAPDLFTSVERVVVIDHHIKVGDYETAFSYIEPSASSTCEIVSELLEQALPDGDLTKDEAEILLAGMLLDTKQFTRNTGSRTFGAAQYLRNQGAIPVEAQELYQTSFEQFERETRFQSKLKMYKGDLVVAVNDYDDNLPGDRVIGAKVADRLLELHSVKASFAVCKIGDVVYVSARSAGKINVQQIMEHLGGGGSYDSSAAQMEGATLESAVTDLKEAIDIYYREVNK